MAEDAIIDSVGQVQAVQRQSIMLAHIAEADRISQIKICENTKSQYLSRVRAFGSWLKTEKGDSFVEEDESHEGWCYPKRPISDLHFKEYLTISSVKGNGILKTKSTPNTLISALKALYSEEVVNLSGFFKGYLRGYKKVYATKDKHTELVEYDDQGVAKTQYHGKVEFKQEEYIKLLEVSLEDYTLQSQVILHHAFLTVSWGLGLRPETIAHLQLTKVCILVGDYILGTFYFYYYFVKFVDTIFWSRLYTLRCRCTKE
jgi:hypothetical protein